MATPGVPVSSSIFPGAVINHGPLQYEIGQPFDQGGFGTVYHAKRTKPTLLNVVVKVPSGHILSNPIDSQKFEREASILANISHPNVVQIIAFWKFASGEMALVQELVVNATKLTPYFKAHPDEAPSIYMQALYAMRAFHAGPPGAVHRDISPANILINDEGLAKVIDFGLAKEDPRVHQILTMTGTWFGTPGCMAPEQITAARDVDCRADLYALGRSITAALQQRNPQHADPGILPEPWKSICVRLCKHDVDDRYPSAQDAIVDALQRFSAAGMVLTNFDLHVAEAERSPTPNAGWPEACRIYFNSVADLNQEQLELAARLSRAAFIGPFDANAFFDRVEAGSAIAAFDAGVVTFEDCDALGELYERIYLSLDQTRRLTCFRRLCKTAVRWHRYAVMGNVRDTYAQETSSAIQAQLLTILNAEDPPPNPTIYGRNVIPGRSP